MIQKHPFAGWRRPPSRLQAFLLAAALPVSMAILANENAMAMPETSRLAGPAASTDAAPDVCAENASSAEDDAIIQSLVALAAHGLDPASYTGNGASPRDAWLLAAAHLSRGKLNADTLEPRLEADSTLAETFDALPRNSD